MDWLRTQGAGWRIKDNILDRVYTPQLRGALKISESITKELIQVTNNHLYPQNYWNNKFGIWDLIQIHLIQVHFLFFFQQCIEVMNEIMLEFSNLKGLDSMG